MKRKIYNELLSWKTSHDKSALLLLGPRQVGKSYIIREFCKTEYANLVEINFERQNDMVNLFSHIDAPTDLKIRLTAYASSVGVQTIGTDKTVFFLDEIQRCPQAVTLLKFMVEENMINVIASGSMLGVSLNKISSFPVGFVHIINMYPMDFEEFLWANGFPEGQVALLKNAFETGSLVDDYIHKLVSDLLIKYIVVGGMPAIVQTFVDTKDIAAVYQKQTDIIRTYKIDIGKYADTNDMKIKIVSCYDSIPEQLAKDNKKFQYKVIKQGGNARYFDSSIDWLLSCGMVYRCERLDSINNELLRLGKSSSAFKLYTSDIGLLTAMYGPDYQLAVIKGDLGIAKGALYEQLIAQMLVANHIPLFYYAEGDSLEIDFIYSSHFKAIPIEVKSGNNTKAQSLKSYIKKINPEKAIKFSMNNVNVSNDIIKSYPLYMAIFLTQ